MTTNPDKLGRFEGHDVLSTTVAIRNTGDGLSKAMAVDPVMLKHGARVHVVLECEVEKIRHDPIDDTDGLQRVHMLKAGAAVIVDEALVRAHLDDQQRRIEEAAGISRLPLEGDDGYVDPGPEGYEAGPG